MALFRKIGGTIKRFTRSATENLRSGLKRYGPQVLSLSQAGLGLLGKVPGTVGMVSRGINSGLDVVKGIIDKVPNQKAQEKLHNIVSKVGMANERISDSITKAAAQITPAAQATVGAIQKVPGIS
jgi:hypothetical protein